jgi:hypothetical protein
MTESDLPWWLAEFYVAEDLRDVETRLLVQRTAILAIVGAVALWTAGMQYTSALEIVIAIGGFAAFLFAMPGVAQLTERATLWWSTRHYPLEGVQRRWNRSNWSASSSGSSSWPPSGCRSSRGR